MSGIQKAGVLNPFISKNPIVNNNALHKFANNPFCLGYGKYNYYNSKYIKSNKLAIWKQTVFRKVILPCIISVISNLRYIIIENWDSVAFYKYYIEYNFGFISRKRINFKIFNFLNRDFSLQHPILKFETFYINFFKHISPKPYMIIFLIIFLIMFLAKFLTKFLMFLTKLLKQMINKKILNLKDSINKFIFININFSAILIDLNLSWAIRKNFNNLQSPNHFAETNQFVKFATNLFVKSPFFHFHFRFQLKLNPKKKLLFHNNSIIVMNLLFLLLSFQTSWK